MAINCDSSNCKSNVLCNNPSPSTSLQITIPSSTWHSIINNANEYERCVHGNKDRMYRILKKEPQRIQFRPIKYSGRSRIGKAIKENLSEILVDGVVNSHLTICKCKRLIARTSQFGGSVRLHLKTEFHSKACPPALYESKEDARITDPHKEIRKAESVASTNPRVLPISSSNEPVPVTVKMEPTSPLLSQDSQDFLDRKYKLEALLRLEPLLFIFLPALSIPGALQSPPGVFREFTIAGFETDDLIVCTCCHDVLNIFANDRWNVDTHMASQSHYENVWKSRGFRVRNFDGNLLKRDFE